MKFSNFEFLQTATPELYKLATVTEESILENPVAAMVCIKQITNGILGQLAGDHGVLSQERARDGLLHSLWKDRILSDEMYLILREIELFDPRESEMMVDASRIEFLFGKVLDFAVWFYKNYVDEAFVPQAFLLQTRKSKEWIAGRETKPEEWESDVDIEGKVHKAEWEKSLQTLENYGLHSIEDGETYEGQIVRGMKHGQGIYTWRDGTLYRGCWQKDMEHGYGEKKFAGGDVYRGYWKYGLFDGPGTYIWKDGARYEGQWKDGFEHGFGTKTSADGAMNKGFWTYGEFAYSTDQLNGEI